MLISVRDHNESITLFSPFSTLCGKVFAEEVFWPRVDVFVLAVSLQLLVLCLQTFRFAVAYVVRNYNSARVGGICPEYVEAVPSQLHVVLFTMFGVLSHVSPRNDASASWLVAGGVWVFVVVGSFEPDLFSGI